MHVKSLGESFLKINSHSSSARQLPRKHANSFRSSPNFFKNFLQVFSTTKSTLFHLNTLKSSSPSLATPFLTLRRRPRGLNFRTQIRKKKYFKDSPTDLNHRNQPKKNVRPCPRPCPRPPYSASTTARRGRRKSAPVKEVNHGEMRGRPRLLPLRQALVHADLLHRHQLRG